MRLKGLGLGKVGMEKLKFSHKGGCEFRTPQGGVRNFRTGYYSPARLKNCGLFEMVKICGLWGWESWLRYEKDFSWWIGLEIGAFQEENWRLGAPMAGGNGFLMKKPWLECLWFRLWFCKNKVWDWIVDGFRGLGEDLKGFWWWKEVKLPKWEVVNSECAAMEWSYGDGLPWWCWWWGMMKKRGWFVPSSGSGSGNGTIWFGVQFPGNGAIWLVPNWCLSWFMSNWCSLIEEVINKIYNLLHHILG